jgi:hypothetical protein
MPGISKVEFESLYFAIMPCGIEKKRELAGAPSATKCLSRFSFLTSFDTYCREDVVSAKHRFKAPKQFVMAGRRHGARCAKGKRQTTSPCAIVSARPPYSAWNTHLRQMNLAESRKKEVQTLLGVMTFPISVLRKPFCRRP